MPNSLDITRDIKAFRTKHGLKQYQLAAFLGVTQKSVSRWEDGERPSAEMYNKLTAMMVSQDKKLASIFELIRSSGLGIALIDNDGKVLASSPSYTHVNEEEEPSWTMPEPNGSSPTVIIVEDDTSILKATTAALLNLGMSVIGVESGHEAIRAVKAAVFKPVVAVLDFNLPDGLDGVDTAHELRQLVPRLQVIMVTGAATHERKAKADAANFELMVKPIDVSHLLEKVQHFAANA